MVAVRPSAPTSYGPAPVVEVETPTGETHSVWLFSTVLRRAFERANVEIGEHVLIRYRWMVERVGEPDYHDFRLVVDRPLASGPVDWKAIAELHGDDETSDDEQRFDSYAASAPVVDEQRSLSVTVDTYSHVLVDEAEVDYQAMLG